MGSVWGSWEQLPPLVQMCTGDPVYPRPWAEEGPLGLWVAGGVGLFPQCSSGPCVRDCRLGWCSQAFRMCAVLCCWPGGLSLCRLGGAPSLQLGWYGWHKQGVCREHWGAPGAEWGEHYSVRGGASGSLGEAASGVSAVGRLGTVSSHTCVCVYTRVLALTPYPPHPAPASLQ